MLDDEYINIVYYLCESIRILYFVFIGETFLTSFYHFKKIIRLIYACDFRRLFALNSKTNWSVSLLAKLEALFKNHFLLTLTLQNYDKYCQK